MSTKKTGSGQSGAKRPGAGNSGNTRSKATSNPATGRRAKHSAKAKDPVTIDMEPTKAADTATTASKATTAGKASTTKPTPSATDKATTSKTADAKTTASKTPSTASVPKSGLATGTTSASSKTSDTGSKSSSVPKPAAASKPSTPPSTPKPTSGQTGPAARSSSSKQGVGFGRLLAAGLVGGVITLGGAWLLGAFADDDARLASLRSDLDARIAAVENAEPAAPADTITKADVDTAIQTALAEQPAPTAGKAAADPRVDQLTDELAATQQRLDELRTNLEAGASEGNGGDAAIAALSSRVAELSSRIDAVPTAPTGPTEADIAARIAPLEQRFAPLEQRIENLAGSVPEQVTQAIAPVKRQLEQSLQTVSGNLESATGQIGTVGNRLAATKNEIDKSLSDIRGNVDGVKATLTAQDEKLAAMAEKVADTDPERRAATALALANLRTRVDDGEAYETELQLVRQTNPKIDLTPLDATAGSGIPTLPQLQARFDEAGPKIVAAVKPVPEDAVGGLFANFRSVVKVKPLDGEAGTGVESTVGAIRSALASADLATADTAWQSLPEPGKQASQDWHAALEARMKAKGFLSEALASLLKETGG